MIIKNEGTVNFWFDMNKNPNAFTDGANIKWCETQINGENALILSESKTLTVIMNPNTDREITVFKTSIEVPKQEKHMVTISWSPEQICLYFNGDVIQIFKLSDLN